MFSNKTNKYFYWAGIILFFFGTLDPMEGSILILIGSLIISSVCFIEKIKYWKLFLTSFISIAIGVSLLWFFSSLGGFGGTSSLSKWWGLTLLPYPLGWLSTIVLLILRKHPKKQLS